MRGLQHLSGGPALEAPGILVLSNLLQTVKMR